jgi:lysozyme
LTSSLKTKLAAGALALSIAGGLFIQRYEGTRYKAYLDPVGIPTICSGSTPGVKLGMTETSAGCQERLRLDVGVAGKALAACATVKLTQAQYDALVSLTYNIGSGAFCKSTLVRKLNAGDCLGASREFPRWNRAGGRVLNGLTTRRIAEGEVFKHDC